MACTCTEEHECVECETGIEASQIVVGTLAREDPYYDMRGEGEMLNGLYGTGL